MLPLLAKNKTLTLLLLYLCSISICKSQDFDCTNSGVKEDVNGLQIMLFRHHSDSALAFGDSILTILEKRNLLHCEDALWTKLEMGEAYEFNQTHHKAIELYHEIIPIALKQGYQEVLAETYISLARSHEANGRGIDTKRYLDEANELVQEYDLERTYSRLAYRASSYYRHRENRDTAIYLAEQAVKYGTIHNRIRAIGDGYMLLGMFEQDSKTRQGYFAAGRDINIEHEAYHSVLVLNASVAGEYVTRGEMEATIRTARDNFEYARRLKKELGYEGFYYNFGLYRTHQLLSRAYANDKDSVAFHNEKIEFYHQKFNSDTDTEKMSEIEIKNSVEIEKLKRELVENELKAARQTSIMTGILGLIAITFLYFLTKNNKRFKKQNALISSQNTQLQELNKRQEILLSEVHHRVKNNLQNVISLLSLQEMKMEDPTAKAQINDISNKIYSIALIHEQLYRDGDFEIVDLHSYFDDLVNHYKSISNQSNKEFNYTIDTNKIKLNIETVIPLGIVCAEVINNTVKYGDQAESINIEILTDKEDETSYLFKYKDSGSGFPKSVFNGESSGMGMILLKSMSRQLNGKLELYNKNGAVTELTFNQKEVSKI